MTNEINTLINCYRNHGIIIDANLLLLLFIGSVNKAFITKFKRTKAYIPEDYELLTRFLGLFSSIVTLPNILTEVGNLANSGGLDG